LTRISRIHHAQITIPQGGEGEARDFYCRLLALAEIPKPAALQSRGGFWLRVGDQELHVGVEDNAARGRSKAHIAYQVDDLAGWQSRLAGHGIPTEPGIPIPGYTRCEFRDPFGNRIELIQRLSEDSQKL